MAARPSIALSPNDPKTAAALRLGERVQSGAARITPWPTVQRLAVGAVYDKSYAAAAVGAAAGDLMQIIRDLGRFLGVLHLESMTYKIRAVEPLPIPRPSYCPEPMADRRGWSFEVDGFDFYEVACFSADKKLWIMEDVADPPACGNTCQELLEAMGVPPEYGWLVRHGNTCCFKPQVIAATLHRLLCEGKQLWVQSRALGRCELTAVSLVKGNVRPRGRINNPLLVWPANRGRVGGWEQRLLVVPGAPHVWLKLSLRQAANSGGAAVTMHVDPTCGQYGIDEPYKVWHDKSPAPPYALTIRNEEPAASLGLLNEANFKAIAGPLVDDLQYKPQWLARILERLGLSSRLSYAIVPARLVLEANGKLDEHVPPGAMLPAWVLKGAGPMPAGLPAFVHGRGTGGGAAASGVEGMMAVWL